MKFFSLFGTAAFAAVGVLALAACSNKPVPPCPQVRVDSNTASVVNFAKNERDLTQVTYAVGLLGYDGQCKFTKTGVEVSMDLTFDVFGGPAVKGGKLEVPYFVAIPQFYPKDYGKRVFTASVNLPKAGQHTRFEQNNVKLFIPLKKDEPGAAYDVYVGLQMSEADAEYNRARRQAESENVPQARK